MKDLSAFAEGSSVVVAYEAGKGCNLVANKTYYFATSTHDQHLAAIELAWDNALAGVVSIESTNFAEIADSEATSAAHWCPEVSPSATMGSTGSITWSGLVGTIVTGAVGCSIVHLSDHGAARRRVKIVVGATGGYLRVCDNGKG